MQESSRRTRTRKKNQFEVEDELQQASLSLLEQTDSESAALIRAILLQDQENNPYDDDPYDNAYAVSSPTRKGKRNRDETPDEELDDDFVPSWVQQKLKKLNAQKNRGGSKRRKKDTSDAVVSESNNLDQAKKEEGDVVPSTDSTATSANGGDAHTEESGTTNQQLSSPVSNKPQKNTNSGKWTDDEEKRFLEGLELFGRDWGKLQEYVGTRDRNAIRSHAQKHFIRLYRDGLPLPAKVLESGEGYTLSGKPLDPDSAAARQYLGRGKDTSPKPKEPKPTTSKRKAAQKETSNDSTDSNDGTVSENTSTSSKKRKQKKKPFRETDLGMDIGALLYGDDVPVYSKDRLRDRVAISWKSIQVQDYRDPLTLVKTQKYDEGRQPFQLLLADLHAHLARVEIIGFLAGTWDAESKVITITDSFPCKSIATGDDETNVEMDPHSELEVRAAIAKRNLRIVGWYHSHPLFPPDPSIRDIENQLNYQKLFVDTESRCEPFVGAIIGTYDTRMPSCESIINWFYVDNVEFKGQPFYIVNDLIRDESTSDELEAAVHELLQFYSKFDRRTQFKELWRYNLSAEQKEQLQAKLKQQGGEDATTQISEDEYKQLLDEVAKSSRCTKLDKCLESLKKHLPSSLTGEPGKTWLDKIRQFVETSW